jgi:hypothetical protein
VQLRDSDFIGSAHRHELTTRNIPELGICGNKVRQARHVKSHPAAFAAIACMLLVRRQLTAASPLLPVDLLRIPIFTLT